MAVSIVVKDGDVEREVDPESVAELFEMATGDLKTWTDDLIAEPAGVNPDGSYRFIVRPADPSLPMAVIRLRY